MLNLLDLDELKKKYAEIAYLKKEIEHKLALREGPYKADFQNMVRAIKPTRKGRGFKKPAHASIHKATSKITTGTSEESPLIQYITANQGMSIMTPKLYEQRLQLMQQSNEVKELMKEEQRIAKEKARMRESISKYRVQTDSSDRITIENVGYAIAEGGQTLYPITYSENLSRSVKWKGWKYTRDPRGVLHRAKPKSEKLPTNPPSKQQDSCRYFTRTGTLTNCFSTLLTLRNLPERNRLFLCS